MSLSEGFVYFTCGSSHCDRLIVSLHSLRQHNQQPVTVLAVDDGLMPHDFEATLAKYGARLKKFSRVRDYGALTHKIHSLQHTPYDISFFLDADTVVVDDLSKGFEILRESGKEFAFVNFAGWASNGRSIKKRIDRFRAVLADDKLVDDAIAYGPAINVGTFVYRKSASWLKDWEAGTYLGQVNRVFIPDEIFAQVYLPRLNHVILGPEWGVSVKYGTTQNAKILHFHGDKHDCSLPMCAIWRRVRDEAGLGKGADNTLVAAVDAKYWDHFYASKKTWDENGITERVPSLLIHDGSLSKEQLKLANFDRVVVYTNPRAESQRELMLSSFVLCAPFQVKTPFWTKLDADCTIDPDTKVFQSSKWRNFDLVSHRWGYTKPGRWVTELEAWRKSKGIGEQFISDEDLELAATQRTFKSNRIQSFGCFHNTASSIRMATPALDDGRLPIPSHDTYFWFMAEALGMKIARVNLKKWGFHH